MRRRLLLIVLALWLWPTPSQAAWAFVQVSASVSLSSCTSCTNTTPGSVTSGNTLVAWATWATASGAATFSGCGATWTTDKTVADATNVQSVSVGHGTTPSSGACTVTATVPAGSTNATAVAEYSGLTASPVDVSAGVRDTTCTTVADTCSSGSATTTVANDAIIGWFFNSNATANTFVKGASPLVFNALRFNALTNAGGTLDVLALEDVNQPSATSTQATGSFSAGTTNTTIAIFVAMKQAASGAASPCRAIRSLLGVGC